MAPSRAFAIRWSSVVATTTVATKRSLCTSSRVTLRAPSLRHLNIPVVAPWSLTPHLTPQKLFSQSHTCRSPTLQPPADLDENERSIFEQLRDELSPVHHLEVQDASGGCGQMYNVSIASERFRGLSVMKQHRLVNGVLGERIKEWHGMHLVTRVP